MAALIDAVNRLLASGEHKHILSVIKGFRNGAVYGAKIRFPHALVMTFLFRNGSLKDKILAIFEATYTHSRNLALFVFAFKGLTSTLSWGESKSHQLHAFLSAFCAGFVIFGKYNKVNEQFTLYLMSRVIYGLAKLFVQKKIVPEPKTNVFPWFAAIIINLYLMSRVIYGLAKLFVQKKIVPEPKTNVFPWFAAIMWGLTLWLFEYQQSCLQPSLVASMTYIYKDSEKWTSLRDFLLYNE